MARHWGHPSDLASANLGATCRPDEGPAVRPLEGKGYVHSNPDFQREPTFRDLVDLIRRGVVLALAVGIGAALLTYLLTSRIAPTYQASATVLASQQGGALQQFGVSLVTAPTVDITAYQAAATSNPVVTAAMQSLGVKDPSQKQIQDLLDSVTVRVDSGRQSSLLRIDVKSGTPQAAANTANALANALLAWDKKRATLNLRKIVEALQGQIAALNAQIAQARASATPDPGQISGLQNLRAQQALQLNSAQALENSAVGELEILEPAVAPILQVAPRPLRDSVLAFILGLALVYGLLLLRDALDTRFRSTEDLTRVTNLPIIAEFPRMGTGSRRLPREAVNYLRTNVLFATSQDHPKVLLVTSSNSAEGKTSVAMGLAESFARNDYRTLLLDGDLRSPQVGTEYGLTREQTVPIRALLESPTLPFQPASVHIDRFELDVVPCLAPAPSPSELLTSGFAKLIGRCSNHYDVVIVDSAPILPVADALVMAPHCTGVIFSVSLSSADRRSTEAALSLLERIGTRVLGLVVTNIERTRNRAGDRSYGYGYGYGEGRGAEGSSAQVGPGDPGRPESQTALPANRAQGNH